MIRRKLTLKRVDPWSVLKFGFVVNIALLVVGLLAAWILWTVIGRLGLVDQFCDSVGSIVLDLQQCSLNGGNIFRTLLLLGLLGVVVQTGIMVFGAFLYNLIADLTGGLGFTFFDEAGDTAAATSLGRTPATGTGRATGSAQRAPQRPADQSSAPARPTPDGSPRRPDAAPQSRPGSPPTPTSDRTRSGPTTNPEQHRPSSGSSGSLWGDPTRSNDRG